MQLGVYIHIPFCVHKCPYCDFNSYGIRDPAGSDLVDRYLCALEREIQAVCGNPEVAGRQAATLFFGGGTPSLMGEEALNRLLATCREALRIRDDAEITLEANPGTVDYDKLKQLRQGGFNRISFGAQSFQEHVLKRLGRLHTEQETVKGYDAARRAGFENINLDLIFSVPGQALVDWDKDLRQAVALEPEHISAYSLSIEPDTEFGELYRKGAFQPVDEATDYDMFNMTLDCLVENGYDHYEISNYARPGKQCRHNLLYWHNEEWLGFGAGAHQHLNGVRSWNFRSPEKFAGLIETHGDAKEDSEQPGLYGQMCETMMVGLRLAEGIACESFSDRFGLPPTEVYRQQIDRLVDMDLLQVRSDRLSLTRKGILLANVAFREFV